MLTNMSEYKLKYIIYICISHLVTTADAIVKLIANNEDEYNMILTTLADTVADAMNYNTDIKLTINMFTNLLLDDCRIVVPTDKTVKHELLKELDVILRELRLTVDTLQNTVGMGMRGNIIVNDLSFKNPARIELRHYLE